MPHRQERRPARPGRNRRGACALALTATWVLAFVGDAVGGHVHPAAPTSPLPAIVLVGLLVVVAIPVAGFTCAMTALVVAGVRRVRSVEDVGQLMSGAAGAYRDVFTRTAGQVPSPDRQVLAEEPVRSPETPAGFHAVGLQPCGRAQRGAGRAAVGETPAR